MEFTDERPEDLRVYGENKEEAEWIASLDPRLRASGAYIRSAAVPQSVNELADYARPDGVIYADGEPRLVIERTSHVPTGHNIAQRFDRVVRAAELGVPFLLFGPFMKEKGGENPSNCYLHKRYFEAMNRVEDIHNTPILAARWPDDNGTLVENGSETRLLSQLVTELIDNGYSMEAAATADMIRSEMEWGRKQFDRHGGEDELPDKISKVRTDELIATWQDRYDSVEVPSVFLDRPETVVYEVGMSPEKCDRSDPYVGTQFLYDYLLCRTGETMAQRTRNFVFDIPGVGEEVWTDQNPNNPNAKSGMWYEIADTIALSDAVLYEYDELPEAPGEVVPLSAYETETKPAD